MPTDLMPPDNTVVVLKYLTEWKFDQLLKGEKEFEGKLWFSHPDGFEDKKEGTFPNLYGAMHAKLMDEYPADDRELAEVRARLCGVCCLREGETEEMKMWDEYVYKHERTGVAIKATIGSLRMAIGYMPPDLANSRIDRWKYNEKLQPGVARVHYTDRSQWMKYFDFSYELSHYDLLRLKEPAYAFEKEVRYVARSPEWVKIEPMMQSKGDRLGVADQLKQRSQNFRDNKNNGFNIWVDLKTLIHAVIIHPNDDGTYSDWVKAKLEGLGLSSALVQPSDLK